MALLARTWRHVGKLTIFNSCHASSRNTRILANHLSLLGSSGSPICAGDTTTRFLSRLESKRAVSRHKQSGVQVTSEQSCSCQSEMRVMLRRAGCGPGLWRGTVLAGEKVVQA